MLRKFDNPFLYRDPSENTQENKFNNNITPDFKEKPSQRLETSNGSNKHYWREKESTQEDYDKEESAQTESKKSGVRTCNVFGCKDI